MASPRLKIFDSPLVNHLSPVMHNSHIMNKAFVCQEKADRREVLIFVFLSSLNPPPNFAQAGFSVFQRCLFVLVTIFSLQRGPIGQIFT